MRPSLIFSSIDKWLLRRVHDATGGAQIRLALNNGNGFSPPRAAPVASVLICDRRTLARLFFDPEVGFGDAYAEGHIQVEGNLVVLLEAAHLSMSSAQASSWYSRLASHWLERAQANTLRGSRKNIHHHYDLTTDFYKLWLDPQLVYTCAYFPSPSFTIEKEHVATTDHFCRKLQLQHRETVVEAGSGGGSRRLYRATHYCVSA